MHDFEILYADEELNNLLSSINESDPGTYMACHGTYHAKFVAERTGSILADLHFDKRIVEVGKIAGLLHDIGCISGKRGHAISHAIKSSQMCEEFLCKTKCTPSEKNTIMQAIADHSDGDNINSAVGAALLIADKTDLSKKRILNPADVNTYHKNLLEVKRVDVFLRENMMTINFVASEQFSASVLRNLWDKAFIVPAKAAQYFGCSVTFSVNGSQIKE